MADKRVGGIFASSFIAGILLAAAIVSPRAWEPVPGPYFGLDDSARPAAGGPVQLGDGIEAAHAELSLRARTAVATTQPAPASPASPSPASTSPFPESSHNALRAKLGRTDVAWQDATDSATLPGPRADAAASAAAPADPASAAADPNATASLAAAIPTSAPPSASPLAMGPASSGSPPAGPADPAAPPMQPQPQTSLQHEAVGVIARPESRVAADAVAVSVAPAATPMTAVAAIPTPPATVPAPTIQAPTSPEPTSSASARQPPERVALADAGGPAGARALASALPSTMPPAAPSIVKMPVASGAAPPPSGVAGGSPAPQPPESLKALVNRVQSTQPGGAGDAPPSSPPLPRLAMAPSARPLPAAVGLPPAVASTPGPTPPPAAMQPPGRMPAVLPPPSQSQPHQGLGQPGPNSWAARLPAASQPGAIPGRVLPPAAGAAPAMHPQPVPVTPSPAAGGGPLGAAPLPGEPWTDPDGVNWSDAIAAVPPIEPDRRRSWLGERKTEPRAAPAPRSPRILDRFRGGDRRVASLPGDVAAGPLLAETAPVVQGAWPRPVRLEQQLDHLAKTALAHDERTAGEPIATWANQARGSLGEVAQTSGPRDGSADACLIALGETVIAGMTLADTTGDAALASLTRRAALAVARRVAVWRAGTALFATLKQPAAPATPAGESDAAVAMTRQFHGRAVEEIGRLLEGIERFEVACTPADARTVKGSLQSICGFYPTAARPLGRAVEDHYLAPNVRIAVHQKLLESLLPAATVDTAPFTDVVAGHEVRGTRTVERKTTLRLVPDDDEICLSLDVQGDIASRSTTDAGAVSVTARSASAFVVHKPISIGSRGLLFGDATGAASNRSRLDTIQTSFDGVPVMGPLVRNIARNQHAETMPEINREVIDKIIARACREVDTQAEPEFARMAERVRERAWMPLVRLGLDPKAVALQTTATTATMRLRLAADAQLAAHTPRPRAPADALLSVQMHESTANNALERLGLAGRRFTLEDLIRTVCGQVGIEPRVPDDLPDDVTVAFAASQPLRVECRDGLVHVRVALDAIESGRRDWYDLVAHVAYRPVCKGPQVFLEREGPIQLAGPGTEGRMELALRTIFGKIFPKERPVPVLPEKIVANPRLTGVQATQAVSSDGWLALTLEQGAAPTVAQPAAAPAPTARPADARRRPLFR